MISSVRVGNSDTMGRLLLSLYSLVSSVLVMFCFNLLSIVILLIDSSEFNVITLFLPSLFDISSVLTVV